MSQPLLIDEMLAELEQANVFAGFECLTSGLLLVHQPSQQMLYANEMAYQILGFSKKQIDLKTVFDQVDLLKCIKADAHFRTEMDLFNRAGERLGVYLCADYLASFPEICMIQFFALEKKAVAEREVRFQDLTQAHRHFIRNLAHEIKNPLGGIRGAAQLLEWELNEPHLQEYTQVMMKEVDRLRVLLDRLLLPDAQKALTRVNIHEVCEYVSTMILVEFPYGLQITRDYDVSLPAFLADRDQLIQVLLNVMRNAAQALKAKIQAQTATIHLSTRIARQVTLAGIVRKLALDWRIQDNGAGVPAHLREQIFYPMISGHEQGVGLGLTIAQHFIVQHGGRIDLKETEQGAVFQILLPMVFDEAEKTASIFSKVENE